MEQRLFAGGGSFLVATELIIDDAHVVPRLGVARAKVERAPACENCFNVTLFPVELDAESEIGLRRRLRCRTERLTNCRGCGVKRLNAVYPLFRFHEKLARIQIVRTQPECRAQQRERLTDTCVRKEITRIMSVDGGKRRRQSQGVLKMLLGCRSLLCRIFHDCEIDQQHRIPRDELLRAMEIIERAGQIAFFRQSRAIAYQTDSVARTL